MSEAESAATLPHSIESERARESPVSEKYERLADPSRVALTVRSLEANGFRTIVVPSKEEARKTVEELLPQGAEVFDSSSVTLEETGIARTILESGRFHPIRPALLRSMSEGKKSEARRLGASPDYIVGSVHAITEKGQVVVASATGSQLGPYSYGAEHVIWVAGTQKIVKDLDDAFDRIYSHTLPRESERARKAYGVPGSVVAKMLVVNREVQPGRVTIILVNERLGF
ncbi:MAG: lactate utilization protein [Thermoplasmata archaeon]